MGRTKSGFGKLLDQYRYERGLTQVKLQRALARQGFVISVSAINKYELGERTPSPEFVYYVARCLNLPDTEREALFEAALSFIASRFIRNYMELLPGYEERRGRR